MANKIIGRTDTSGAVSLGSVTSNSKRPILLVGQGADETKEVIFDIGGTQDAITHFGKESPFVEIVKVLVRNGVKVIQGINVGSYGEGEGMAYATITEAYDAAYDISLTDNKVMAIILDTTEPDAYENLPVHLSGAEQADIYRYAVVGFPVGTTDAQAVEAVKKMNCDRMFAAFPNMVNADNQEMDGAFAAAGLAAILATQTDDPALPTNSLPIAGFGGVAKLYKEVDIAKMVKAGISPLVSDNGTPTTYRVVTTAQGSGEDESIWHDATTRLIADDVLSTVLAKLKANYKRTKNITRVFGSIRSDVITILDKKLASEIIESYDKELVTVQKDPEDRYGALVDFEYTVVSPLYTITVTQHVKI